MILNRLNERKMDRMEICDGRREGKIRKNRFLLQIASINGPIQPRVDALESGRQGEGGSIEN
jgi:hypothetical protein